jgi:pimeloyl-ACP methyl ester carboxylesterase
VQSFDIDGLRVAYQRAGQGPPLLLLHGILADSRAWRPQLEELSRDFTVVAWDAPGTGRSSDPSESLGADGYAACLESFIDELELGPVHLAGHSWGGGLAQELYGRRPERVASLILVDTYAGWRGSLPAEVCEERLKGCLRESELPAGEFIPGWIPGLLTENASQELRDELIGVMSDFHPAGYRAMARAFANLDTRPLLAGIRVPTLLVWGAEDKRSPLNVALQMRDAIPRAELVVIPNAGHESYLEQAEAFNEEVRRFCFRLGRAQAGEERGA